MPLPTPLAGQPAVFSAFRFSCRSDLGCIRSPIYISGSLVMLGILLAGIDGVGDLLEIVSRDATLLDLVPFQSTVEHNDNDTSQ